VRGDHRNVYYGLGYSGHGVTLANLAGKIITDIYSGDNGAWRDLPFINAGFASVPLEPFRWIGYQAMTRLTGKSPRV
jgi:glycine/D-amino acid oxidase-like deaminating enzyme